MARTILTVNATQVDNSGHFSTVNGFPKLFDSDDYEGDIKKTNRRAKAAAHAQLALNYAVDNRPMQTVTIDTADGRRIFRECDGELPGEEEE